MSTDLEPVAKWRKNLKQRALALFGSKCCVCGYNRCAAALEFHHLDPSKKDFTIAQAYANPKKWVDIVSELEKCVLLCANCHREVHQQILVLENKKYILTTEDYRIAEKTHHKCKCCNTIISLSKDFCSTECAAKSKQKVNWYIEKDRLFSLREEQGKSFVAIGVIYGVSDNTIRKWYNKFKED